MEVEVEGVESGGVDGELRYRCFVAFSFTPIDFLQGMDLFSLCSCKVYVYR